MSAFDWHNTVSVPGRTARRAFVWLAAALALANAATAFGQGANSIDSLTVSKGTSGNTIVKFVLKSAPANPPAGFAIASPPRIALDFLDTGNGLGATQRVIDDPALRSLNVIQSGNRTRVVFNLNKPQTFSTQVEGNAVLVTLFDQSERLDAKTQVVERFAEARPTDVAHALRDVDFRRGANGEGRVVVDLSDNGTGIDIRQQGKNLIVDFIKTNLPRNLERRLDVQDFGTPIVAVDTFNQGGNTRMVIEPKGLWEHSAYQTDNRFILEVRAVQEDPNRLVQGAKLGYKGEKLSLNFQNVEVRSVLQVIADFTGLNIITSDTVGGSLTLRLKDIPWDQALDIIMQTKGLDMRKNGNVVLIAPREELALKEKQQLENALQIAQLEPLVTESFQLNYMKVTDFERFLASNRQQRFGAGAGQTATTGGQGSIISERGVVIGDPRTNILIVSDTASRMEEVRKLLRQLDTPIRQVMIEARIVIASDKFSKQLGVRFGAQTGFTFNKYAVGQGGNLDTQPVVHLQGDKLVRDTRTQTPFELASGLASAGYSDSPQLNVNLPVANAAGQLRADAHQPRQRQSHQPRAVRARSGHARQGYLEPARGDGRQSEGAHRAGHRNPVRDARQREFARHGGVQEGGAAARSDAADHAGQPHHHDGGSAQGQRRAVRRSGRWIPRAVDRHPQRADPDPHQQRGHGGHRRDLRGNDHQRRHEGAGAG